jgi:hypothetical protein
MVNLFLAEPPTGLLPRLLLLLLLPLKFDEEAPPLVSVSAIFARMGDTSSSKAAEAVLPMKRTGEAGPVADWVRIHRDKRLRAGVLLFRKDLGFGQGASNGGFNGAWLL